MIAVIIIVVIIVILLLIFIGNYNGLVGLRNRVKTAITNNTKTSNHSKHFYCFGPVNVG